MGTPTRIRGLRLQRRNHIPCYATILLPRYGRLCKSKQNYNTGAGFPPSAKLLGVHAVDKMKKNLKKQSTLEDDINDFLTYWDVNQNTKLCHLLEDYYKLYNVTEDDDWVAKEIGGDEQHISTVRLIRTVYLISQIADGFTDMLQCVRKRYPKLWKRLEEVD